MKKTVLTAICLFIYTFFEVVIVLLDVSFLTLGFILPISIGFIFKSSLGGLFPSIGLVLGVALLGITYVYRKNTQNYLKNLFRPQSERIIEKVRLTNYFNKHQ
jgi:hypothetical protein